MEKNKKILSIFMVSIVIVGFSFLGFIIFPLKDTTAPTVEIISPIHISYNVSVQLLQINAVDNREIDTIWYNWDGTNVTYTSGQYITFNEGTNIIYAWTNDSTGNEGALQCKLQIVIGFTSKTYTQKI